MTLAVNLANLANYVNASGKLDAANGLVNALPPANGGTGQSTYTNGQLLIGNSDTGGLNKATLSAGAGINITNTPGGILLSAVATAFPAGTAMLFAQTSAPPGWTKSSLYNDYAIRVVSGTTGSGGTVPFSTAFSQSTTGATALSIDQMPSHNHGVNDPGHTHTYTYTSYGGSANEYGTGTRGVYPTGTTSNNKTGISIAAAGGSNGHTHSVALNVQYVDMILATKD